MREYNKSLKVCARQLRANMTDAEKLLWSKLKAKQLKSRRFYRQKVIGKYIVDFYCPKANLVVELDGGQHYTDEGSANDKTRDEYLSSVGLKVLRFSDTEALKETDAVLQKIWNQL